MPATMPLRPRERLAALAGVLLVQIGLGAALLLGLRVDVLRHSELVSRLIDISLQRPPPPPPRQSSQPRPAKLAASAAPKPERKPIGGSPGPVPSQATPAPTPIVALHATAPPSGGG